MDPKVVYGIVTSIAQRLVAVSSEPSELADRVEFDDRRYLGRVMNPHKLWTWRIDFRTLIAALLRFSGSPNPTTEKSAN